jgi:peptidoglycan/LPS O-acetylase OafA/YrhL
MHYRPEVDGLRAVAVLPVMFFHAGFEAFGGGFVGVDVFFVISGYLITSLLLEELDAGRFSLVKFYERRARRILPALFFVMLVCLPFAWSWLVPSDLEAFAQSVVAVTVFASNVLFWLQSGYFDTAGELKPLLHTWSLAVEEQYYLLFPLFLLFTWRFGRARVFSILASVALASLALAEWGTVHDRNATFFLLPARAWELFVGSLVAYYLRYRRGGATPRPVAEAGALAGMAMIAYGVFSFDASTPFPGFAALWPTLGTASIIVWARPDGLVGRLLSWKPVVGIGLVSYSAYLWHQPLFAFARHRLADQSEAAHYGLLIGLTFALAYFSWRFVEKPFRDRGRVSVRAVFSGAATASAAFLALGLAGFATAGFVDRARWRGLDDALAVAGQRGSAEKLCAGHAVESPLGPLVCVIGDPGAKPDGVLWGDSYAGSLRYGLHRELVARHRSFYFVSSDGCVPIEGVTRTVRTDFGCTPERHARFVREFLASDDLAHLVWIGAFSVLTGDGAHDYVIDGKTATPAVAESRILSTLAKLRREGKKVVIVPDTPTFPNPVAHHAIRNFNRGGVAAGIQVVDRGELEARYRQSHLILAARRHAVVIDSLGIFCGRATCSSHTPARRLLYIDVGHLSHTGSQWLARHVVEHL